MDIYVVTNKAAIIERCLERIRVTYDNMPACLQDFDKQDIIILNLQRACQAAIDLANHICAKKKLGLPQNSGDSFALLADRELIPSKLATSLKGMVGFRNIAVHDYQTLNLKILQSIVEKDMWDLEVFTKCIFKMEEL
ncbi:MAG: DUF86 domain-containing protein [Turicibacter sp.]|nr:DUF86 domain-containing protein [Turicibacter sp.]